MNLSKFEPVSVMLINIICSILMNVKFKPDEDRFKRFMILIAEGFRLFEILTYVTFIPAMRRPSTSARKLSIRPSTGYSASRNYSRDY